MREGSRESMPRVDDYASGLRIERTLAYLEAIADPIERVRACEDVADQARGIQGMVAAIRRRGVYEATLRPGASGESVAAELGVSPKAVSVATSRQRAEDLELLRRALEVATISTRQAARDRERALHSRDVLSVARATLRVLRERAFASEGADTYQLLEKAHARATALAMTAGDEVERPAWQFPTLAYAKPSYEGTPSALIWPAQVLNALPGILADGYLQNYEHGDEWVLSWKIRPAASHSTVFDAGPHRDGWAVSEWLVWLARDFSRSGKAVWARVSSPPPYLNEPGESMSFLIEGTVGGEQSVTPRDFAEAVVRTWNETGFVPVEWPEGGNTS